jgi:predicted dehydrogenase
MLKILHIGCGSISNAWLSALSTRDDIEICGLVDIDRDAACKKTSEFNLNCPVFTDAAHAIDILRPDIAVDNIVPSDRLELAQKCMSKGLHVMSEKPLADNIRNAKRIIELSDKYNRNFIVMQNRRYSTGIFTLRNAIQSGLIGDIGCLSANFFRDPHFGGFRDEMTSPLLIDMAIHTFDQARFLLDANPVSVICREFNPKWSWYKGNASAVCIFTFENGVVFSYTGSWCSPGMKTSWDAQWRAGGSLGTCCWDGYDLPTAEIRNNSIQDRHPVDKAMPVETIECALDSHAGCINEMIESIKEGRKAATDCRDNIISLSMVFSAIKSSVENREVLLKELLED